MKKINVAEVLKDCPKGMELYSPIYGLGILTKVTDRIHVKFPKEHNVKCFRPDGKVSEDGEIMLYPKDKTTWEGFQRPFKDGDILSNKYGRPFILKAYLPEINNVWSYCGIDMFGNFNKSSNNWTFASSVRYATEEEKKKLFQAIKDNGYKWNPETKTLEKLVGPKFHVGAWVVNIDGKVNQVVATDDICDGFTLDDNSYFSGSWKDMYHLWTIEDAKEGDVLVHNKFTFIFMGIKNDIVQGICTELGDTILNFGNAKKDNDYCPATKEQRDLLFEKIKESGYEWDAEKKELRKIEQNPAWSEEDEMMLEGAIDKISDLGTGEMVKDWLKSLKDRLTWKPSDKQMEQLGWIAEQNKDNMIGKELMTLYNDLKKLKE